MTNKCILESLFLCVYSLVSTSCIVGYKSILDASNAYDALHQKSVQGKQLICKISSVKHRNLVEEHRHFMKTRETHLSDNMSLSSEENSVNIRMGMYTMYRFHFTNVNTKMVDSAMLFYYVFTLVPFI